MLSISTVTRLLIFPIMLLDFVSVVVLELDVYLGGIEGPEGVEVEGSEGSVTCA